MTRQEKEAAILAYCEEVTKGYDTPRGAGFVTIQLCGEKKYRYYMVRWTHTNGGEMCAMVEIGRMDSIQNVDLLYLLLGLETRALEAEIERRRVGYLSARVKAANAFQEIEEQAFGRGHHYKSVDVWDADKVAKNDEFLGKVIDARKKFNEFVDAFIDPPTP